jgi:monoamine oxidase
MTRKEFLKICGILGIGLPMGMTSCGKKGELIDASSKVIIIGAGAAGLSAAYLLKQKGINAQILEAAPHYGGRMKRTIDFADFPIPLGAEWLHVEKGVFEEIVNDTSVQVEVPTTLYNPAKDYGIFEGMQISVEEVGFTIDQKFINGTWFDFFEQYITPSVKAQISYNQVVTALDYSGDEIMVKTANDTFVADKVIITVPVKMLQNAAITFMPELPSKKVEAINKVKVWDGCKAFIEFKEKFYPTFTAFEISPASDGQKLYYDAAYGQNTSQHILGLFAVGTGTLPYVQLSDADLIDYMLTELDGIFNGQASKNYIKHIFQNWNKEPFIKGAYVYDDEDWRRVRTLGESVDNKLFFAGTAYTTGDDWSSVHTAARSAKRAVNELVS